MNKVAYPAVFVKDQQNDSGYSIYFPNLPGAFRCGDTLADAMLMAQDRAGLRLFDELKYGHSSPESSTIESVSLESGQFVHKHSQCVVRKNGSIPAWLNPFGKRNTINFSKVLTRGLERDILRKPREI